MSLDVQEIELDGGWAIRGKLHGGYLLASVVRAAMRLADPQAHPDPVAASAMYVAPAAAGPATVRTRLLRAGRSVASYQVTLEQAGHACVETFLTAARLPDPDAVPLWAAAGIGPPTLPPPDACLWGPEHEATAERTQRDRIGDLDVRLDPSSAPPPYGPGGAADFRAWARLSGEWDPVLAQYVLADALPPVTFDLGIREWVPTLQLQVIVRRRPAPGWQRARQSSQLLVGGLMDEDCTLWDSGGQITAQARQLAAVRGG